MNPRLLKHGFNKIILLLSTALLLRVLLVRFLSESNPDWLRILAIVLIIGIGAVFVIRKTAEIIEETTEVLQEKTKLAGGLLQSFGTAFPDMVLGVVAATISLNLKSTDYARAINFAVIAAATTFGSNIYNVGHAAWCVFRQNKANKLGKHLLMFPRLTAGGVVRPIREHTVKPSLPELETATDVSVALTVITSVVALSMVLFGKLPIDKLNYGGDLYQLIRPAGVMVFVLSIYILYAFRKNQKDKAILDEIAKEENKYRHNPALFIWIDLVIAGISILLAADSMIRAIETLSVISGLPFVLTGVFSGVVGCLGEMTVVHNYSVHPRGRIGDAITGVAMDNIVTIIGASIVAMMGGIFLGGSDLIVIFVVILCLNTVLIWQIVKLRNYLIG